MRYILPIALGLLLAGCSLPNAHDPKLTTENKIPVETDVPPTALSDGSLWQDRLLLSDGRARRINDLLTIRVTESTTASSKADVNTSRVGANSMNALTHLGGNGGANGPSTNLNNTYAGAGVTDRSAAFTTTITARVVKVLANGNLIFEGYRDIQLNNETQRLYVAGMVHPSDLDVNNSISSSGVAELRVGYGGNGVVDQTTQPGYVSRLLNYVWPF